MSLFKKNGNVLISHTGLPCSTIGAIELNFRVRDGIGWILYAIVTVKKIVEIMNVKISSLYDKIKLIRSQVS